MICQMIWTIISRIIKISTISQKISMIYSKTGLMIYWINLEIGSAILTQLLAKLQAQEVSLIMICNHLYKHSQIKHHYLTNQPLHQPILAKVQINLLNLKIIIGTKFNNAIHINHLIKIKKIVKKTKIIKMEKKLNTVKIVKIIKIVKITVI